MRRRSAACRRASASSAASLPRSTSWTSASRPGSKAPLPSRRRRSRRSCVLGFETIERLTEALGRERYLVDEGLATVIFLALRLRKPLHLRAGGGGQLYAPEFLVRRPLLEVLEQPDSVLLIDELDRADDEFEAFLLEFLADFQVTIPELGVVAAREPPAVVVTSNRTRELHEALKRRCLYHWIEHPELEREVAIVLTRLPDLPERLARQVCAFVQELRWLDLYRAPGVGETLDWASALDALGHEELEREAVERTLG